MGDEIQYNNIDERNEYIINQIRTGSRQVDLAKQFNLSRQRIEQIVRRYEKRNQIKLTYPKVNIYFDRNAQIINAYQENEKINDIAEKFNLAVSSTIRILNNAGISCGEVTKAIKRRNEEIGIEYLSGKTQLEVSKEYKLSLNYVNKILNEGGYSNLHKIEVEKRNEKIVKLHLRGVDKLKIAKQFNMSPHNVVRILKSKNIEIKPRLTKEELDIRNKNIINLYLSGMSIRNIAKQYSLRSSSTRVLISKAKITDPDLFVAKTN